MVDSQTTIIKLIIESSVTMLPKETQTTENQLPFEVDAAVLEKVAEFRSQQQESLKLDGPPDGGNGTGTGETKIDF